LLGKYEDDVDYDDYDRYWCIISDLVIRW
jgi:hypothetical protein